MAVTVGIVTIADGGRYINVLNWFFRFVENIMFPVPGNVGKMSFRNGEFFPLALDGSRAAQNDDRLFPSFRDMGANRFAGSKNDAPRS
jgi:hypothetical protein